jgi:hypothetical protein
MCASLLHGLKREVEGLIPKEQVAHIRGEKRS